MQHVAQGANCASGCWQHKCFKVSVIIMHTTILNPMPEPASFWGNEMASQAEFQQSVTVAEEAKQYRCLPRPHKG